MASAQSRIPQPSSSNKDSATRKSTEEDKESAKEISFSESGVLDLLKSRYSVGNFIEYSHKDGVKRNRRSTPSTQVSSRLKRAESQGKQSLDSSRNTSVGKDAKEIPK